TVDEEGNEEPIEAGMLSKQIEKAQKKVEEQNFLIRKRVLEYDDVMNEQRRIVYEYRDGVLEGKDMRDSAREQIGEAIGRVIAEYTPGDYLEDWDMDGLWRAMEDIWPISFGQGDVDLNAIDRDSLADQLTEDAIRTYDQREEELGEELMRALERYLLLQIIDQRWREHLYDMDYLREGIHLRGFAQIDPLIAYKNEAFDLFTDLMNTIWSDFARMIFHVEVEVEGEEQAIPAPTFAPSAAPGQVSYTGGAGTAQPSALMAAAPAQGEDAESMPAPVQQRVLDASEQVGRNDPCWCGSGRKFKKCHGA
ncbi:MAG: secA, partial [Solirubrobacterales bacterium]|nr:secA [Solirubrobacterales bacterium]